MVLYELAYKEALKSTQYYRLGVAGTTSDGHIFTGHNYSHGLTSCHAEMAGLNSLFCNYGIRSNIARTRVFKESSRVVHCFGCSNESYFEWSQVSLIKGPKGKKAKRYPKHRKNGNLAILHKLSIDLIVVRVGGSGNVLCSRPCLDCRSLFDKIRKLGVTVNVTYIDEEGEQALLDHNVPTTYNRKTIPFSLF